MAATTPVCGLGQLQKSLLGWITKAAVSATLCALGLTFLAYCEMRDLPSVAQIRADFRDHFPPRRVPWVPLSAISPKLRAAVVASEDHSFYRHHGFDYDELWASLLADLAAGRYRRGGSTITQQVAKNAFLSREKTISRKFREAILTWRLEHALSKDQILEAYLNVAGWGDGLVGAASAAHFYFSKPPAELTWAESATLAGILSNPEHLNPLAAPKQAQHVRQIVLLKLLADRSITLGEYEEAVSARLPVALARQACCLQFAETRRAEPQPVEV